MVHLVLMPSDQLYHRIVGFEQNLKVGNSSLKVEGYLGSGNGEIIEVFVNACTADEVRCVRASVRESLGGDCIGFEVI